MKKATWIALGALIALVGIYFVVKDEPVKEVDTPLVIEPVPNLSRIEIVPPDSADDVARPDLIVFEKGDTAWTLVKPVQADLKSSFAARLDEAFAEPIRTDDFKLSADKKDEYGLTDATGVRVSLYAEGSDVAAAEFRVGHQITVPETGVKRTYISKVGDGGLYRAQAALGDLLRTPLDDVRSKRILDVPDDGINAVTLTHPDGTEVSVARDKEAWVVTRNGEPVDFEVDPSRIEDAMSTLSRLRATGFYDPGETETDQLPDAQYRAVIEAAETHELSIGTLGGQDDPKNEGASHKRAFVRTGDTPYAYQISSAAFETLTADVTSFRTRTPNPIEQEAIERVTFAGDKRIVIERDGGEWTLAQPSSDDFNATRAESLVRTLSSLRVHGYPPVEADPELGPPVATITIETADAKHALTIGQVADTDDHVELHLARFGDGPVFYLKRATVERLTPALADLEGAPTPSVSPGNMPKGMPEGLPQKLPENMKMPRGEQQQ